MSQQRCGNCGTRYERIPLPNADGWIRGCPKCVAKLEFQKALKALIESAKTMVEKENDITFN